MKRKVKSLKYFERTCKKNDEGSYVHNFHDEHFYVGNLKFCEKEIELDENYYCADFGVFFYEWQLEPVDEKGIKHDEGKLSRNLLDFGLFNEFVAKTSSFTSIVMDIITGDLQYYDAIDCIDDLCSEREISLNSIHADCLLVAEEGAKKYSANNWKKLKDGENRFLWAALRHAIKIDKGEVINQEDFGLPHLAHMIVSLTFAHWHSLGK